MSLKRPFFVHLLLLAALSASLQAAIAAAPELATLEIKTTASNDRNAFDGVVEAVRQTVISAQVSGVVVQMDAKVGDRVKAGQVLLRIDSRAADQNAAANQAQVQAARASLDVAAKDYQRQKQLFEKAYISQAALEIAESRYRATQAQVNAQIAQASVARTQTDFNIVRAPYAGVLSDVPTTLGDMAMPGRPLLTIYDPTALRVTASVPQTALISPPQNTTVKLEIPGIGGAEKPIAPTQIQVLPRVDASTHTVQVRADLPSGLVGATPGMFARLWLPTATTSSGSNGLVSVPASAIVRRAEMTGLYVLDANGRPLLRQVRLGRVSNGSVEVLAGLAAGERIALDPQAAARVR